MALLRVEFQNSTPAVNSGVWLKMSASIEALPALTNVDFYAVRKRNQPAEKFASLATPGSVVYTADIGDQQHGGGRFDWVQVTSSLPSNLVSFTIFAEFSINIVSHETNDSRWLWRNAETHAPIVRSDALETIVFAIESYSRDAILNCLQVGEVVFFDGVGYRLYSTPEFTIFGNKSTVKGVFKIVAD
jgi:hypothetical protein